MPRPSRKSPTWPAVAAKAKKIERLLAERFRARWKAVETDFTDGIDVAKARARFFLANGNLQLSIARRYYNPARATKFANYSVGEIVELCWPWFNPFQVFAHNSGNDLSELGDQLEVLIGSEYVAMTWGLFDTHPGYTESFADFDPPYPADVEEFYWCDSPDVYPLPDLITEYGDVFEGIVYSDVGERLRVCKSTAEPFLAAERVAAMDEIERRFLENALSEGDDPRTWRVNFRCLASFLLPRYGRALIEADILGDVGTPRYKDNLRMLREELKANGDGYLVRGRAQRRMPAPQQLRQISFGDRLRAGAKRA
jgi:hypothetical protein